MQIGFVPEEDAPDLAAPLDQGYPHVATITKILTGGRAPIPVVQAYIYRPDAGIDGTVLPIDVPARRSTGCASLVVFYGAALAGVVVHQIWG